tara:strand:+ start:7010 stop:7570 length:561 start_codon:yes stop_codon:yes gene_type:complete
MSLTKEQIVENVGKYIKTGKEKGFLTPELEELLGNDFIVAPSSTQTKYGNAFEGGLVDHILRVMKYAYKVNMSLDEEDKASMDSLIKVVYLHQIGKAKLFIPKVSKWHNDRGIMYDFNEDISSMRVGERSIHYCITNGVTLSEDEYIAILNHDKTNDLQAEHHNTDLGEILNVAIRLAIMKEKKMA